MSESLDRLAAYEFGYLPDSTLDLLRRAAAGEDIASSALQAEVMDFRHWEGITPADVPMVTALDVGPGGAPRALVDDVERQAVEQARTLAAKWLTSGHRWLCPLLHHAGAIVTLAPKHFGYTFEHLQPPTWIPIGWLSESFMPQAGPLVAPAVPDLELARYLAELGPIIEALPAMSGPIPVITWHQFGKQQISRDLAHDPQALEADLRLRRVAVAVVAALDILALLREAGAVLFALPGRLFFSLPAAPLSWIEIPGVGRYLDAAPGADLTH